MAGDWHAAFGKRVFSWRLPEAADPPIVRDACRAVSVTPTLGSFRLESDRPYVGVNRRVHVLVAAVRLGVTEFDTPKQPS